MREITFNGYIADEVWFGDEVCPEMLHGMLYPEGGDPKEEIHMVLNSYGGSCNAAVRMSDDLRAYPGGVTITVSGTAASAATVLAMGADLVEMTDGSLFMIHDPSTCACGNERDLKEAIRCLQTVKDSIINVYERKTGLTREKLDSMMSATTWLDAKDALNLGFIDGLTDDRPKTTTNAITDMESVLKLENAYWERRKAGRPPVSPPQNDSTDTETAVEDSTEAEKPQDNGISAAGLMRRLMLIKNI